jgi:hypothetical protein
MSSRLHEQLEPWISIIHHESKSMPGIVFSIDSWCQIDTKKSEKLQQISKNSSPEQVVQHSSIAGETIQAT